MEVLLLQEINGIGKKDDLLIVGDGYALNHLLPMAKALVATPTVRRRYAERIRSRALQREAERSMKANAAAALAGKEIVFARKATKTGKLYAAITEEHVVEALKLQHTIEVKEDAVNIAEAIKALGTFQIKVRISDVDQNLKVTVKQEA